MTKPRGAHREKRLNALAVKRATKPGRYADGQGLYLVLDKLGGRWWVWRGLIKGRKVRNRAGDLVHLRIDMGLGGARDVSLAEARELAAEARKLARSGINPIEARAKALEAARRKVPTFSEAALAVHAEHSPSWKNPKHAQQWLNTLEAYVFPHFGDLPVDEVDSPQVLAALSPIWIEKPETARRVKQRIGAVLDWAHAQRYRSTENPVRTISRALPKQKAKENHHEAMPYVHVPEFLVSLAAFDAASTVKQALELTILTATRTNEVLRASPDEFDLEAGVWSIPADRMKMDRPHRVPLSLRAVEIVEEAKGLATDTWLFPGRKQGKPLSNMAMAMVVRRMGLTATVHGFRSSFRDWAGERSGQPREVIEAALAHTVRNKAEAAYARSDYLDQRRDLMARWAAFVCREDAKILKLRAGG